MSRTRRLTPLRALPLVVAVSALAAGCGRSRGEPAGYELLPGPAAPDATSVSLSVVVRPGTSRARLTAIRDELRARHAPARLMRVGFFDDAGAAERPQGPDAPAPEPAWWSHYLAQYNLNRNTEYEWFGRLHADHVEQWE